MKLFAALVGIGFPLLFNQVLASEESLRGRRLQKGKKCDTFTSEDTCQTEKKCIWDDSGLCVQKPKLECDAFLTEDTCDKKACVWESDKCASKPKSQCKGLDETDCGDEDKCDWNDEKQKCMEMKPVKCKKVKDEQECIDEVKCDWHVQKNKCVDMKPPKPKKCKKMDEDECVLAEKCDWNVTKENCSDIKIQCDGFESEDTCDKKVCIWDSDECTSKPKPAKCKDFTSVTECNDQDKCAWNDVKNKCMKG